MDSGLWKLKRKLPAVLTVAEVRRLIAATRTLPNRAFLQPIHFPIRTEALP